MRHPRPPPLPTVIPLPHRHRGYPLEYGGTVAHGNFYPKNGKTQGAPLKKIRKLREGVPFRKGVYREIFGNGKNAGRNPLKIRKLKRGYPFGRGFTGKIWREEKFILYL